MRRRSESTQRETASHRQQCSQTSNTGMAVVQDSNLISFSSTQRTTFQTVFYMKLYCYYNMSCAKNQEKTEKSFSDAGKHLMLSGQRWRRLCLPRRKQPSRPPPCRLRPKRLPKHFRHGCLRQPPVRQTARVGRSHPAVLSV